MYNKQSSLQSLYSIAKKICFLVVLFFLLSSFAYSFSLDTALLDVYNSAVHSKSLHSFPKAKEEGDLFKKLYKQQHANQSIAFNEWLQHTWEEIASQWWIQCSIEKSHIHDILFRSNTSYRQSIQINIQEQLKNTDVWWQERKNNLNLACVQVVNCINTTGEIVDVASRKTISECTKIINDLYKKSSSLSLAHAQITKDNEGDQRFENGTLEDSSFDLLLDIQNIGDILFGNNKQVPELLFYQMPSWDSLPSEEVWINQGTEEESETNSWTTNNSGDVVPTFPLDQVTLPFIPSRNPTNTTGNNSIDSDDIIGEVLEQNPHSTQGSQIGTTVFWPNWCLLTGDDSQINTWSQWPTRDDYQDALDQYNDSHDPVDDRINDYLLQWGSWTGSNGTGSAWTGGNTDPTQEDIEDLQNSEVYQECKDSCADLSFADQVLCMAECMCWIWPEEQPDYAKDLMTFNIRFCMIPAQATTSIVSNKSVMSIEEIIDEINNILYTLQASGEMGKHNHTTEFLDSSQQNIKLHELVVFNIAIAFKPIFDSIPDIVIEKERKEKNEIKEKSIINNTSKNKYLTIADPIHQAIQNQKTLSSDHYEELYQKQKLLQQTSELQRTMTWVDHKTQNFGTTERIINDFVTNNLRFWAEAGKIMHNIQEITLSLKNKIEKGS